MIAKYITGRPLGTYRVGVSDVARSLTDVGVNTQQADGILVTCEDNDARIALGGILPTQGASAVGHILYQGDYIYFSSGRDVTSLEFINRVNGSNAVLQITLFKHT